MPVFAAYTFADASTEIADGAAADGIQHGIYLNGAVASAGQVALDGSDDIAKIFADPSFQLDRGTLQISFVQSAQVGTGPNTVLSRDHAGDVAGGYNIDVLANGTVRIVHETAGGSETFATFAGFNTPGDRILVTYAWDQGGSGGALRIENATTGAVYEAEVPPGLTMDMGGANQPWVIGAGQDAADPGVLNDIDQHFNGTVQRLTLSDSVDLTLDAGVARNGIVSGTGGSDLIDTAYTGDPDGDRVDAGDALLPNAAPDDDLILAGAGNDTVRAGLGDDSVQGEAGRDRLEGSFGNDTLDGGDSNDTLVGGDGRDVAMGGAGDDLIDTGRSGTPLPDRGYGQVYDADRNPLDDTDTVFGGSGNDTIRSGDDADVVFGGTGNDSLDGGVDDDRLLGGDGADTVIGGEGSDLIEGEAGNDLIYGGLTSGPLDVVNIPDATDLRPDNGRDTIYGGAGNDTIIGQDDDDQIAGGAGNDLLDGNIDNDRMRGDEGDDTLIGGGGRDTLAGGADRDTFLGADTGDRFDGNETGVDFDTLDLRGAGPVRVIFSATNAEDGTVEFLDADRNVTGTASFVNIENVIPCFTPGTLIATPKGEVPIENLQAGDRVITRDNGLQEVRWAGAKALTWHQLAANPHLQPVLIRRGSLGHELPERDMMVSPNHRMLVANDRTALYFDEHEVLVAAKHLTGGSGIHAVESMGTTYLHILFDRHEVVLANGAWTESFQPGDYTLKGMGNAQRTEIFQLFPDLKTGAGVDGYVAARRTLKRHEARLLVR